MKHSSIPDLPPSIAFKPFEVCMANRENILILGLHPSDPHKVWTKRGDSYAAYSLRYPSFRADQIKTTQVLKDIRECKTPLHLYTIEGGEMVLYAGKFGLNGGMPKKEEEGWGEFQALPDDKNIEAIDELNELLGDFRRIFLGNDKGEISQAAYVEQCFNRAILSAYLTFKKLESVGYDVSQAAVAGYIRVHLSYSRILCMGQI